MKSQNTYQYLVTPASPYHPFGMIMSERSFSSEKYRYGFNSQEKDDEIAGSGNINTAEYWEYDCRLGRRWNLDPIPKSTKSNYSCLSNNPILRIDPRGDDDYTIDKNGHLTLSKKTDAKSHTIYNADKSKSLNVSLDFFKSKHYYSEGEGDKKTEATVIVSKNYEELEKAYKFFADNSEVEWEFSIFQNKNTKLKAGSLTTSHTQNSVKGYASMPKTLLIRYGNINLIYNSHSHPNNYDSKTGWPAYPSGFTYQYKPDKSNPGDRDEYVWFKKRFGEGRIPSTFEVYIPARPDIHIEYDDENVYRSATTEITKPEPSKN